MELLVPIFEQAEVVELTGISPVVLDTWSARGNLRLTMQHPGRGRPRRHSPVDVVKIAIMGRLSRFGMAPSVSSVVAEDAVAELMEAEGGELDWGLTLVTARSSMDTPESGGISLISAPTRYRGFEVIVGDATHMGRYVEWFDGMWSRRFSERDFGYEPTPDNKRQIGKIDPARRAAFAEMGIHAEPVLIFPLGEIVNGTLLRLRAYLAKREKRT